MRTFVHHCGLSAKSPPTPFRRAAGPTAAGGGMGHSGHGRVSFPGSRERRSFGEYNRLAAHYQDINPDIWEKIGYFDGRIEF
jgi:hypothetical protein